MGGFLFEHYMWSCCGYSQFRRWPVAHNNVDDGILDEATQLEYIKTNLTKFVGWLLLHTCSVGYNGRTQLFYLTFILHYYGLSRQEIESIHKYGYGVSLNMFDRLRLASKMESNAHTR